MKRNKLKTILASRTLRTFPSIRPSHSLNRPYFNAMRRAVPEIWKRDAKVQMYKSYLHAYPSPHSACLV